MTDPVPERLLPLLRQRLDAAAGLKSSSLLYATIVFVAALPVVGPSLAGAWFAGMAILYLVEKGLGGTGEAETAGDRRMRTVAAWLINLGFSLAASFLL